MHENQTTILEIASVLRINRKTVDQIVKRFLQTGEIQAGKRGSTPQCKLNIDPKNIIKGWLDRNCTLSVQGLIAEFKDHFGITVSTSTMGRIFEDVHYSLINTYYS